jgi:DNA ligase-1
MLFKKAPPHFKGGPDWLWSEKFDGQRAFWDGGASRGVLKSEVAWANCAKDARYVVPQVATGLWSRYGNVLHAPAWWLDQLPAGKLLDGELWMGRGTFNKCRSTVSRLAGDWSEVKYMVFDEPSSLMFGAAGRINNVNWPEFQFRGVELPHCPIFEYGVDDWTVVDNGVISVVRWSECPWSLEPGMEGVVVRRRGSWWKPHRVDFGLKVVLGQRGTAIVEGWTCGKGKYEGLIGALIVVDNGVSFQLSGMPDSLRVPGSWYVGQSVAYEYMELTPDGKPRQCRLA